MNKHVAGSETPQSSVPQCFSYPISPIKKLHIAQMLHNCGIGWSLL